MKNVRTRQQFDALAQTMVGLTLAEVAYHEIAYRQPEPNYLHQMRIGHCLDYGLELIAEDGQRFSILWDETFLQFGLGIYPHTAEKEVRNTRRWLVAKDVNWAPLIGKTITAVEVYWSWVATISRPSKGDRTYYPQDLVLCFSDEHRVHVSASEYWYEKKKIVGNSDNILVVFSEQTASKHHLGPFAKEYI